VPKFVRHYDAIPKPGTGERFRNVAADHEFLQKRRSRHQEYCHKKQDIWTIVFGRLADTVMQHSGNIRALHHRSDDRQE